MLLRFGCSRFAIFPGHPPIHFKLKTRNRARARLMTPRPSTLDIPAPRGKKTRVKTMTKPKPTKIKPAPKKKGGLIGSAKGLWLDPNYDFTKPTCPHWN
jgi:hypothetical protein